MTNSQITLNSGNTCNLIQIKKDLIPNYFILSFPINQGEPSALEITEMLNLGVAHAQILAFEKLNDKEAFSILYSGYSARREKGWHIHIVLLGNRWKKSMVVLCFVREKFITSLWIKKR